MLQMVVTAPDVPAVQLVTRVGAWVCRLRHCVVVKLFDDEAAIGAHDALVVQAELFGVQTVAVKPLADDAGCAVQLATAVAGDTVLVLQLVTTKLPLVPPVHESVSVGPVASVAQVVAVQLLPDDAAEAEHEATPVGPVVMVLQLVAT
ncbi:MAG: hypothetical protein KKC79_00385 [Gammaproteobacteria bacterium]|nr:hypothetical protein [Gammaproteobacteria bacterium]